MSRRGQLLCCLLTLCVGAASTNSVLDSLANPLFNSLEPPAITGQSTGADAIATSTAPKLQSSSRAQTEKHLQHADGGETPNEYEKHLVVAQHREDISWLDQVTHMKGVVYQNNNSSAPRTTVRNMGEAVAYLQYIVDFYEELPRWMVFVHAHNSSEHMPDKVDVLQRIRWGQHEYANLRYENITLGKWGLWTGDYLHPTAPEEGPARAEVVWDADRVALSRMYAQLWGLLFERELGPLPEWVHSPCCAEFVVSKQRVRQRPLAFYASLLNWLGHTSQDRYNAGLILEYSWHIIFGEPPVYHAPPKCDLLECSPLEQLLEANPSPGAASLNTTHNATAWTNGTLPAPADHQRAGRLKQDFHKRHLRQQQHHYQQHGPREFAPPVQEQAAAESQ